MKQQAQPELVTTNDVVKMTGVSHRQLQWWDEKGVLDVPMDGHCRSYRPEDLATIRIVADLRRKGMSLQKIRGVLNYLRRHAGKQYLMTDGRTHILVSGHDQVVAIMREAKRPMLLVDLILHGANVQ